MVDQPDDLVLRMLREIRGEMSDMIEAHSRRFDGLEKRLDDLTKLMRYTLGQTNETQFRQVEQESRIDQLFNQLEQLLAPQAPV